MKAYKVFFVGRRDWRSGPVLMSVYARGAAQVYYTEGEWSEAPSWLWEKGYGLCCFKTEAQAKDFMESLSSNSQLWEVEMDEVLKELPPRVDLTSLEEKNLHDQIGEGWPEGTIMARRVKPLRYIRFYL